MTAKRPLEGGGGGGSPSPSPSPSPALKKRCRSFDLEIRGCRHLEELVTGCVQRLEAAVESAISRIPEVVTKALTGYLSRATSLRRTLIDQNQPPRYKLKFMNGLRKEIFTKKTICAANGDPLKISMEENHGQRGGSSRLFSAKIKVVVLDGDFNRDNNDCWTSEDFSKYIVRPRDKVGAVLTGELEVSLTNGEADLCDATFIDNSKFTRSGKFRLGVMVVDELGERVQEGITEPFTVKDRRGEGAQKHVIPSLDDDVWRLKKISKDGVFHEALKGSSIFSVKDLLRLYYKDEHTLRKVLTKASNSAWRTITDHAKKCDPGKELYSFIMEGHNVVLFFNSFYRIVGVTSSDQYTPFKDLNKSMQDTSFDISVFLDSGSEQYCVSTAANDIPGSVTLHCPATTVDEFSGSVLLKQASFTMGHEDYGIFFGNSDDAPTYALGAFTNEPIYSRHVSFKESDCHEMLALGAEPAV